MRKASLPHEHWLNGTLDSSALHSLLESYFQSFGGKPCCYEDLKPYIEFEGEDLAKWTAVLEKQTAAFVGCTSLLDARF